MGIIRLEKGKFSIRASPRTLNQLRVHFEAYSYSEGELIQTCIMDAILNQMFYSKSKRKRTAEETRKLVSTYTESRDCVVHFRLEHAAIDFICDFYFDDSHYNLKPSITTAILCCIADVCDDVALDDQLTLKDKLMYMIGQKNETMLKFLKESFQSLYPKYPIKGYAELFCGTANVLLHMDKMNVEFLNDNSDDLIALLRTIKEYPYLFKVALWQLELSRDTFVYAKNYTKEHQTTESLLSNVEYFAYFWFKRYTSLRGTGHTFSYSNSLVAYREHLDIISPISKRLENVTLKNNDAIYFGNYLHKELKIKDYIVYIDSPYIFTESYYKINRKDNSVFNGHLRLRNLVEKFRDNGNYAFVSYRITVSETMKNKGITSEKICKRLDTLYCNRGFYYRLQPLPKGQVEILLCTVNFHNSIKYDTPLA